MRPLLATAQMVFVPGKSSFGRAWPLRILALETSTAHGSVALLENNVLVHETILAAERRTAQALAPAMAGLFQQADWAPRSIELVVLDQRPRLFHRPAYRSHHRQDVRLRNGARLVALDTLRVLVEQLRDDVSQACAVMDAQRRQLLAALFCRLPDQTWAATGSCQIVERHELAGLLSSSTLLTGPVLSRLPPPFLAEQPRSDPLCWMPRASTVGRLAWQAHLAGRYDDPLLVQPRYHRPSYAEEKGI